MPDRGTNTVEEEVLAAEEHLRSAMLISDVEALDELVSAALLFTSHTGQVFGKKDDLDLHRSGALRLRLLEPSEVRLSSFGETAVVSVRMRVAGVSNRVPFDADLRYTRVWCQSQSGNWQVVAGHCGLVQE